MYFGFYKRYKIENCKLKEKWKIISFYQFYYKKLGKENVLNISLNLIRMWCEPRSLLPSIMSCYIKFFYKKKTNIITSLFNKYIQILKKTKTRRPRQSARRRTTITTRDDAGVKSRHLR